MKNLFLAAAAMFALGAGAALADGNVDAQMVQAPAPAHATQWTQSDSGIYVANSPRHEVWVYGAMRGPGFEQGGHN